jgi:predicted Zn-dependent peptidase
VHNLRNAALIVVGDVNPDQVVKTAVELSRKTPAPAWVDAIPAFPPLPLKPAGHEHVSAVVTSRPGALTEVRLGCLLPSMRGDDRIAYEMLRLAIQERLSTALRFERGEGYGVGASMDIVRGGIAFLNVATFVNADALSDVLATLRAHWQRWAHAGFDAGELNVARWLFTGQYNLASTSNAIAYRLLSEWNQDPASLLSTSVGNAFRKDVSTVDRARLSELFSTCAANAVIGLTGHEPSIRHALRRSWPLAD